MKNTNKRFAGTAGILLFWIFLLSLSTIAVGEPPARIRYDKAMVIKDPANKQNISGFVHIALAWGDRLSPPQYLVRGFINLMEAMHRYTNIETTIDKHMYLGSPELLRMPFVYVVTDRAFDISETERKNLKKYLDSGGFLFLESTTPYAESNQGEAALKKMLRDVLGAHARFSPIPNSHPLYHCFFDFDDGPPQGSELIDGYFASPVSAYMPRKVYFLEGVFYRERLAAVLSSKGYIVKWNDMVNNEPQLKMGVNLIVFSLIQKGGIAEKYNVD